MKITRYSVALLGAGYQEVMYQDVKSGTISLNDYKQPFSDINALALKGAFNLPFVETSAQSGMSKKWQFGNFTITNQFFPPKFLIAQDNTTSIDDIMGMVRKIIDFASLSDKIGKIGINFDVIIEKDLIVKDVILKEGIAKEFSGVSTTLEKKINECQKLNLTIAGAKDMETNKSLIYVNANFDNKVTLENTIAKILQEDCLPILEQKVSAIFGV